MTKQRTFKIREKILKCLLDRELRFKDLSKLLEIPKATLSDNLKFLWDNSLIIKDNRLFKLSSLGEETLNKDYSYEDLKDTNKIEQNNILHIMGEKPEQKPEQINKNPNNILHIMGEKPEQINKNPNKLEKPEQIGKTRTNIKQQDTNFSHIIKKVENYKKDLFFLEKEHFEILNYLNYNNNLEPRNIDLRDLNPSLSQIQQNKIIEDLIKYGLIKKSLKQKNKTKIHYFILRNKGKETLKNPNKSLVGANEWEKLGNLYQNNRTNKEELDSYIFDNKNIHNFYIKFEIKGTKEDKKRTLNLMTLSRRYYYVDNQLKNQKMAYRETEDFLIKYTQKNIVFILKRKLNIESKENVLSKLCLLHAYIFRLLQEEKKRYNFEVEKYYSNPQQPHFEYINHILAKTFYNLGGKSFFKEVKDTQSNIYYLGVDKSGKTQNLEAIGHNQEEIQENLESRYLSVLTANKTVKEIEETQEKSIKEIEENKLEISNTQVDISKLELKFTEQKLDNEKTVEMILKTKLEMLQSNSEVYKKLDLLQEQINNKQQNKQELKKELKTEEKQETIQDIINNSNIFL